jgi:hypothetical protein
MRESFQQLYSTRVCLWASAPHPGGGTKPATLETGAVVQVPLFIDAGSKIKVDTRSGTYLSKA